MTLSMEECIRKKKRRKGWSLSAIMTIVVVSATLLATITTLTLFIKTYEDTIETNAITSSEQSVLQVSNVISDYISDMNNVMGTIVENMSLSEKTRNNSLNNLMQFRTDIVAITAYDNDGILLHCWSGGNELKNTILKNLSYFVIPKDENVVISSPHVESIFEGSYPWVVTISQTLTPNNTNLSQVAMDLRFSSIAEYIDDVGIGQHGYCFLISDDGHIVYHPQQQLINSKIKTENIKFISSCTDGSYIDGGSIYTIRSLNNSDWKVIGVSYVDEQITTRVLQMVKETQILLLIILAATAISELVFSRLISKPAKSLAQAMKDFEKNAENFTYQSEPSTKEIEQLSDSFEHMVVQIQELMEKVRNEEITLRKTELSVLQNQINPHFLYNTLDSIAWMCEEERTKEAVEMVNTLARLFRISISKGHELITIDKEISHAESYMKIQKYRYKDAFKYSFHVEDSCRQYLCNKITLQPIIENSIVQGLDQTEEGKIDISIYPDHEDIIMVVADNGIGMSQEQCCKILTCESGSNSGIGIKNVNDRIKIYFGKKYGLSIESELDVGTKVTIRMPKILKEDNHA